MLSPVAEGVRVHQSEFCQTNTVVVDGDAGALLVDPGILDAELGDIAADLRASGTPVAAGFATHPHWDHVLWHPAFGTAPRFATARAAGAIEAFLANAAWRERVAPMIPADIADRVPLTLFGELTGLPDGAEWVPWDGPRVRVVEHRAHATGHAALLLEEGGVLVAGDLLSDVLVPLVDHSADDPIEDYLAALTLIESIADGVRVVVPGHGSVTGADGLHERIELDRAYLRALRAGEHPADDPRLGPDAVYDWVAGVHERQAGLLARR
ncbi:MBL fold metallo-hydrolase [Leifsonia sp. NPDC056824]|uniref:MBL fold metallo-hydrolase n=1 Tax=Leifsonia sp. NPDC056824 TaxID=3345953 RepID=UPI00369454B6